MPSKTPAIKVATPEYWEEACKHLAKKDRVMRRLIPQFGDASLQSRGDAFVTLARCPLDIITALNPSPSGVSMIVPVAPTPCTTPLGSKTSRTRDGAVQPSPVALPALHLSA